MQFVKTTQKNLGAILEQPQLWFDHEDIGLIKLAREAFGEIIAQFEQMTTEPNEGWDRHLDALREHGLLGAQLKFKLAVSDSARNRHVENISGGGGRQPPWIGILAERYLAAADVIIEILSDALGGAGTAIGEFKKMIEWLLNKAWSRWRWL